MINDKPEINRNNLNHQRKRIKQMKVFIVTFFIILLLLPTILCFVLFMKMNALENEIQVLRNIHESKNDEYTGKLQSSTNNSVVHAAEKDENNNIVNDSKEVSSEESIDSNANEVTQDIKIENNKKIYLTFDDGPSIYTEKILDILKEYQIKATFFVIGKTDTYSKSMYQRIIEEGHTLGMHSYSHKYSVIYRSTKDFVKDIDLLSDLLYETTGVKPTLYRFPGGSSNQVSLGDMSEFIRYLNDKGITYFDWNVISGDATGENIEADKLAENVLTGIKGKDVSVVLMHDSSTKENTVNSLPILIRELQKQEFNILPIEQNTVPIQHVKAESIK